MKWKILLIIVLLAGIGIYFARPTDSTVEPLQVPVVPVEREDGIEEFGKPKPTTTNELEYYVNIQREKVGLKPLVTDEQLNESARMKLAQLEREGWGADPHGEVSGKRGYTYIADTGIYCSTSGENLSQTGYGAKNVVYGWMMSKTGHKEALLSAEYDSVGYAAGKDYVVQHFCNID